MPAAQAAKEKMSLPVFSLAASVAAAAPATTKSEGTNPTPSAHTAPVWLRFFNLTGNSRLGHRLPTALLYQGLGLAISNTTTGFRHPAYDFRVRPRCTGKERDAETELDWFATRYMSSTEGRFTSPDPVPWLHWQRAADEDRAEFERFISDPQALNPYAYAQNNPLSFSDPTGMYYCSGTAQQCAWLQRAYAEAQRAAANTDALNPSQRAALNSVLEFLGKSGRVNGVVVKFDRVQPGTAGNTNVELVTGNLVTTITFDPRRFAALAMEPRAEAFIHEGQHGIDDAARGRDPHTWAEFLSTERKAYGVQSYVSIGTGVPSRWGLWDPKWPSPQAEINRQKAIETHAQESTRLDCAGGCQH